MKYEDMPRAELIAELVVWETKFTNKLQQQARLMKKEAEEAAKADLDMARKIIAEGLGVLLQEAKPLLEPQNPKKQSLLSYLFGLSDGSVRERMGVPFGLGYHYHELKNELFEFKLKNGQA